MLYATVRQRKIHVKNPTSVIQNGVNVDDLMLEMAEKFPQYQFEVHKGYGTKKHYEALREFGPSPIHRSTFLKKFYGTK